MIFGSGKRIEEAARAKFANQSDAEQERHPHGGEMAMHLTLSLSSRRFGLISA